MSDDIAGIGIKVDTSGIDGAIQKLDALAAKGAPVEKSLEGIEKASAKTGKTLAGLGKGASSQGLDDFSKAAQAAVQGMSGMGAAAQKANGGLRAWVSGLRGAGDAASKLSQEQARMLGLFDQVNRTGTEAEKKYIMALTDKVNMMRLTGAEQERYIARSKGMSQATQELAASIREQGDAIQKSQGGMSGMGGAIGGLVQKVSLLAGSFFSLSKAFSAAQEWTDMANRLRNVTEGTEGLAQAQEAIFKIAQDTRSPLSATAELYQRIATHQDALGLSSERLAGVVTTVNQAMQLSGVSASSAQAALVQFGQALASGTLRGDELNSILEQAPALAKLFADGLGVSVGKLRELGKEGQITSEKIINALESQAGSVEKQFAKLAPTVGQALTQVNNAFTKFIGQADDAIGLTSTLARGIEFVAKNFETLATGASLAGILAFTPALGSMAAGLATVGKAIGAFLITPMGAVVTAVAGATLAYVAFKDELDGTGKMAVSLGDIVGELGRTLADSFLGATDAAGDLAAGMGDAGAASKQAAEDTEGYWVKGLRTLAYHADTLGGLFIGTFGGIGRAAAKLGEVIKSAIGAALNAVIERAERTVNAITSGINSLGSMVGLSGLSPVSFGRLDFGNASFSDIGAAYQSALDDSHNSVLQDGLNRMLGNIRARNGESANRAGSRGSKPRTGTQESSGGGKGRGGKGRAASQRESEEARAYAQAMEAIAKAQRQAITSGEEYTATQQMLVDLMMSPVWQKMPQTWRETIAAEAEAAIVAEQHAAEQKKLAQSREAARKAQEQSLADMRKSNLQLKEEVETLGMTGEELALYHKAKLDATIANMEYKASVMESIDASSEELELLRKQIEVMKERSSLLTQSAIRHKIVEEQKKLRDELKRTTDDLEKSLTDALLRGFESGKDFAKNFRDTLKNMFQTLVLRPLIQPMVRGAVGGLTGLLGSGAATAGQGGGGAGSGLLGQAGSLLGAGSSLFGAGGLMGALGAGAGWLTGAASFSGIMSAAGSLIGTGTLAGTASGLAMGAGALAPILAPLLLLGPRLFGRRHEQHNLQGTFGGESGFEGHWHDYYRGRLFSSSRSVNTPLDDDTLGALRTAWQAQENAVRGYADALGLTTAAIEGFTHDVNIRLMDLGKPDAEGYMDRVMQRVQEAIAAGSNEMAQLIIGSWETVTEEVTRQVWGMADEGVRTVTETVDRQVYVASEFARAGENALQTLTRLGSSLQTVNGAFGQLGQTLLSASLASGDMASRLLDAVGGGERFGTLTQSYWQNYYSEAERADTIRRHIAEQLGALGVQGLPDSRDAYRALVEDAQARVASGDTGAIALYAALMNLGDAFASVTPEVDAAAEAARAAEQAMSNARSATDEAWRLLADLFDNRIDAARATADAARDIYTTAGDAKRQLWGQSADTARMQAQQGRAFIDNALTTAARTGALPEHAALSQAIDAATAGLDMSQFATVADLDVERAILAAKLGGLEEVSGRQLTEAERQIELLEEQRDYWRKQLDILRESHTGISSISEGVSKLVQAMEAERKAKAEAAQGKQSNTPTNKQSSGLAAFGGGGLSFAPAVRDVGRLDEETGVITYANGNTIDTRTGRHTYASDGSGSVMDPWLVRRALENARAGSYIESDLERLFGRKTPKFADGGYHAGGLRIVGERGPELELTGPSRILNNVQTEALLRAASGNPGSGNTAALERRMDALERAMHRAADASEDTAHLLRRATAGGNAMRTEVINPVEVI